MNKATRSKVINSIVIFSILIVVFGFFGVYAAIQLSKQQRNSIVCIDGFKFIESKNGYTQVLSESGTGVSCGGEL